MSLPGQGRRKAAPKHLETSLGMAPMAAYACFFRGHELHVVCRFKLSSQDQCCILHVDVYG